MASTASPCSPPPCATALRRAAIRGSGRAVSRPNASGAENHGSPGRWTAAFDSRAPAAHPNNVGLVVRRTAALLCVLAFAQGALAECAGWQATAEARRECCQNGLCPLHHHKDEAARAPLTQAVADDCCAKSQRQESNPSASIFASTMTLAVLESLPAVVLSFALSIPLGAPWETPSPPPHVPKHLLLSVLLV